MQINLWQTAGECVWEKVAGGKRKAIMMNEMKNVFPSQLFLFTHFIDLN